MCTMMSLDAKPKDKVRFVPVNGSDYDLATASRILTKGEVYTVLRVKEGVFSGRVVLAEYPREKFNHVMFVEA